jgi:hypothetical protein
LWSGKSDSRWFVICISIGEVEAVEQNALTICAVGEFACSDQLGTASSAQRVPISAKRPEAILPLEIDFNRRTSNMARGGKREGAGRKVGSLTKRTQAIVEGAAASGETPLEFMLRLMRDTSAPEHLRADMAKSAAPYVHPRLSATELKGTENTQLTIEILRFADDPDDDPRRALPPPSLK